MNLKHPLILGSSSPRRQFLMREAGFTFTTAVPDVDESWPAGMAIEDIPSYLAEKKARVFESQLENETIITADTIVVLDGDILNKPADRAEAAAMLGRLSGRTHMVITGVCLLSTMSKTIFDDRTHVTFRELSQQEILAYIDFYRPFDKAGSYGAQDCLPPGYNPCSPAEIEFLERIGKPDLINRSLEEMKGGVRVQIIDRIEGSYFNVMGLPVHLVYERLHNSPS